MSANDLKDFLVGVFQGIPAMAVSCVRLVVSQSGSEYLVDARTDAYECSDHGYRGVYCKHARRVALATGEYPVPADVDGAVPKPKYRRRDRYDAQLSTLGGLLSANARNRGATGQPVGPGLLVRVSE